ncbi:MAG TPA: hypothetical protein VGV57_00335 [Thermoleophilaceae bacterium]|nr:hypothetical protein [Thermoleophilaceae bacterium]
MFGTAVRLSSERRAGDDTERSQCGAGSATGKRTVAAPGGGDPASSGFAPFIAAAATGLGALGWVTAVGGAIVWIHVSQAGLPPAQAVAKVPPSVLIANGAEFLTVAFFASLLTAGVLFLFDEIRELLLGRRQAPKLEEIRGQLEQAREAERRAVAQLGASQRRLVGARAALKAAESDLSSHSQPEEGPADDRLVEIATNRVAQVGAHASNAEQEHTRATRELEEARRASAAAETRYEREAGLTTSAGLRIIGTGFLLGLATFLLAVLIDFNGSALVNWGADELPLAGWIFAAVLSPFVGLVGALLFVRTASFPVFALFSFLAVPMVFAVVTYFRASEVPYVEPVALLQADGTPFVGFFLAETDQRVSVGTFKEATSAGPGGAASRVPARLLSLPAAEVSALTVGSRLLLKPQQVDAVQHSTEPRTAKEWAIEAALLICEDAAATRKRAEADQKKKKKKTKGSTDEHLPPVCSESALHKLADEAVVERRTIEDAAKEPASPPTRREN